MNSNHTKTLLPFTYFCALSYMFVMCSIFATSNIITVWILMEVMNLMFFYMAYTVANFNLESTMNLFIIQSLSSFLLLLFYLLHMESVFQIMLFWKMGMFPFMEWFLSLLQKQSAFIFFLLSVPSKIPLMYMFSLVLPSFQMNFIYLLTLAILNSTNVGIYLLSVSSCYEMLILSSLNNNSWLLLAVVGGCKMMLIYLFVYSLSLIPILIKMENLSSFSKMQMLAISGIPPFPLFFLKLSILYSLSGISFMLCSLFMAVSVFMAWGQVKIFLYWELYFSAYKL